MHHVNKEICLNKNTQITSTSAHSNDNEVTNVLEMLKAGSFKVDFISPATDRQIFRHMPSPSTVLIEETPMLYEKVTLPHIEAIIKSNSLGWIQNILNGTKEKERLLLDTSEYIINIDTKWRSHPDPHTVPREEWHNHNAVRDLYCLGIVKNSSIRTLRDLRGDNLGMLRSLYKDGLAAIEKLYGVKRDQVKVFVHYQPQFYHFHMHFTRLENEIGSTVEKAHLVNDIIQNLEDDKNYYLKRTILYKLRVTDPLARLMTN